MAVTAAYADRTSPSSSVNIISVYYGFSVSEVWGNDWRIMDVLSLSYLVTCIEQKYVDFHKKPVEPVQGSD